MRRNMVAGNWKMNGLSGDLEQVEALVKAYKTSDTDILICPPATLLFRMSQITTDSAVSVGGQDCHAASLGAHTGELSAAMLKDAGASAVILGHSERRTDHGETSEAVRAKARAAQAIDVTAIICVGESLEQRQGANTLDIIGGQLAASLPDNSTAENLVVAYEPIWAIGTGKVPTTAQIGEVHDFIRARLERRFGAGVGRGTRILYGGSVKPTNAAEIFNVPNVDGALVGGASLKADDFMPIINAL